MFRDRSLVALEEPCRGRRRAMLLTPGDVPAERLRALAYACIDSAERALPEARTR